VGTGIASGWKDRVDAIVRVVVAVAVLFSLWILDIS